MSQLWHFSKHNRRINTIKMGGHCPPIFHRRNHSNICHTILLKGCLVVDVAVSRSADPIVCRCLAASPALARYVLRTYSLRLSAMKCYMLSNRSHFVRQTSQLMRTAVPTATSPALHSVCETPWLCELGMRAQSIFVQRQQREQGMPDFAAFARWR